MRKITSLIIIPSLLSFCGCSVSGQPMQVDEENASLRDVFAMDTYMYLKAYGDSAEKALDIAVKRILTLDRTFSVKNTNSDTWSINHAEGKAVKVSEDTINLLKTAQEIGSKTNGALDVTSYPLLKAWGFTMDTQQIPDSKTLRAASELVDFRKISLDNDSVCIPNGMQVDFGSLAKGYTSDQVVGILRESGVKSALVNLGGNVHAVGTKPDGTLWKVGVQDPFFPSEQICVLEISDLAVITSGNYERCFTGEDGKEYWHIIDPKDGYPADNGLVSVTIVGESGLFCDALSTALFVLGTEKAIEYWHSEENFEMILVTDDAKLYYTEGLKASIDVSDKYNAEVVFYD